MYDIIGDFLARMSIRIVGLRTMMGAVRRAQAVNAARASVAYAVVTSDDEDNADIIARRGGAEAIGFQMPDAPECARPC